MADPDTIPKTARSEGLVGCQSCGRVWRMGTERCGRCGNHLKSRDTRSLSRVWAWWLAGVMLYIPANLYPMLETRVLFSTSSDTIIAGAVHMFHMGSAGVAFIILLASVGIPLAKFITIAWLALSVGRRGSRVNPAHRQVLHEVVDFIGRWSMIDVFVVAITSALVQLSFAVTIVPGPAALSFALSVIFTMLSAQAFDTRLIWDSIPVDADKTQTPQAKGPVHE
ncbi:paraquat-inducible protein A [Ketogulonicigenium vulgare]|uniref:paraquat-inducible protein A n=1 Tax=Ketogulonicigenium vulgare TaxID=92945 RepID=UPI0001E67F0D|nr:paraquat-inducible protein A [Ketogulonicigenium vulgare]ADO43416.1 paraquat-inducible protein A [Ketogulonicigenium vulgare Y25]ALJ81810.1 paraquat-inducible protein A [Ketogulonicigenium vulgare]ANW34463.1 paraquat-inducible protein A [Ketogulonicigenium vulgare]AOZ55452.1 paraquat-inducible protein A [Ketogulonicigenium vulgare]